MDLKNVAFFFSGVGIGGLAGFLVTKKVLEKKYSEDAEKKIKEIESYYNLSDEYKRGEDVNPPEEDNDRQKLRKENLYRRPESRTDYTQCYKAQNTAIKDSPILADEDEEEGVDPAEMEHPEEEDTEEDDEDEEEAHAYHQKNRKRKPRIISEKDVGDLPPHVDSELLYYYTENDVLVTDNEEVLDDPETFVGDFDKYGFKTSDERIIFVMNYELDTCYEIQKVFGEYDPEYGVSGPMTR